MAGESEDCTTQCLDNER